MSDFGSVIQINSKKGISASAIKEIISALESHIFDNEIVGFDGETVNSNSESLDDNTIIVKLTEYYFGGDDDDNELFETVVEEEEPMINDLLAFLKKKFSKYQFSGSVEEW